MKLGFLGAALLLPMVALTSEAHAFARISVTLTETCIASTAADYVTAVGATTPTSCVANNGKTITYQDNNTQTPGYIPDPDQVNNPGGYIANPAGNSGGYINITQSLGNFSFPSSGGVGLVAEGLVNLTSTTAPQSILYFNGPIKINNPNAVLTITVTETGLFNIGNSPVTFNFSNSDNLPHAGTGKTKASGTAVVALKPYVTGTAYVSPTNSTTFTSANNAPFFNNDSHGIMNPDGSVTVTNLNTGNSTISTSFDNTSDNASPGFVDNAVAPYSLFSISQTLVLRSPDAISGGLTTTPTITVSADPPVYAPEPASLAIIGSSLVGLGFFGRRRRG